MAFLGLNGTLAETLLALAIVAPALAAVYHVSRWAAWVLLGFRPANRSIGFGSEVTGPDLPGVVLRLRPGAPGDLALGLVTRRTSFYRTRLIAVLLSASVGTVGATVVLHSFSPPDGIMRLILDYAVIAAVIVAAGSLWPGPTITLGAWLVDEREDRVNDGRMIREIASLDRDEVDALCGLTSWVAGYAAIHEFLVAGRHDEFRDQAATLSDAHRGTWLGAYVDVLVALLDSDLPALIDHAERSLEFAELAERDDFVTFAKANLALSLAVGGDPANHERAVELATESDSPLAAGCVAVRSGDVDQAWELLESAGQSLWPLTADVQNCFTALAALGRRDLPDAMHYSHGLDASDAPSSLVSEVRIELGAAAAAMLAALGPEVAAPEHLTLRWGLTGWLEEIGGPSAAVDAYVAHGGSADDVEVVADQLRILLAMTVGE